MHSSHRASGHMDSKAGVSLSEPLPRLSCHRWAYWFHARSAPRTLEAHGHAMTDSESTAKPPEAAVPDSMIARIALILRAFDGDQDVLRIAYISRRTGLPKASVSRIVNGLVEYEFLERSGVGVRLGLKFFELGTRAGRPRDLRKLAIATLADLRRATGHTIHLAVLEEREVVYIEILQGRNGIRLPSQVGGRFPAHATGVGKSMLAYFTEEQLDEYLSKPLEKVGPRSIVRPQDLRVELEAIRTNGVAYEREESGAGICCAASAILRPTNVPLASISISGPLELLDLERVAPAVQAATLGLNRQIRMNPALDTI